MDEGSCAKYREKEPEVTEPAETEKPQETEPAPEEQKTESEQEKSSPLPMIMLLLFVIDCSRCRRLSLYQDEGRKACVQEKSAGPDADYR